jgi:hypothetical protein
MRGWASQLAAHGPDFYADLSLKRKRAAVPHGQADYRYGLIDGAPRQQFVDATAGPSWEFFQGVF